jgi:hypothetical protein
MLPSSPKKHPGFTGLGIGGYPLGMDFVSCRSLGTLGHRRNPPVDQNLRDKVYALGEALKLLKADHKALKAEVKVFKEHFIQTAILVPGSFHHRQRAQAPLRRQYMKLRARDNAARRKNAGR